MQDGNGGDSFLPRIQSVFYAVFDEKIGPKIVYQVPEGLIASSSTAQQSILGNGGDYISSSSPSPDPTSPPPRLNASSSDLTSRNSSISLTSPTDYFRRGRQIPSPQKRPLSSQRTLFNFSDISMYVIPPSALCGRLVICSTRKHRIIGFPVELPGGYKRNYFRYNLCLVFERGADLSCYEPIVRKASRVLKACEEESGFLSSDQTSHQVHAILEQIYEDLNSYSETSIPIDQFNSIELKIFPFYPNPPEVKDWMVPLCLINLTRRIEENWDLTMQKICVHINGVNHVSRIAQLADCDIRLTRQCISHLLFYQVIMTLDIFQYSNMYTLCKSIQWLADEGHVKDECGPYVVKPGAKKIPHWPDLLHLYSRLRTGKTLYEWINTYNVENHGIDVRRFTTFGVIKGFLRRVHRYPVYIPPRADGNPLDQESDPTRKRAGSINNSALLNRPSFNHPTSPSKLPNTTTVTRQSSQGLLSTGDLSAAPFFPPINADSGRPRRPSSAANQASKKIRDIAQKQSTGGPLSHGMHSPRWTIPNTNREDYSLSSPAPQTSPVIPGASSGTSYSTTTVGSAATAPSMASVATYRQSTILSKSRAPATMTAPESPARISYALGDRAGLGAGGTRESRRTSVPSGIPSSPGTQIKVPPSRSKAGEAEELPPYPLELLALLDGDHHTDEIGVRLNVGWPQLEEWLVLLGEGKGNGDYGERVMIIYR